MADIKNIIFDLGGVLLNIDYHKTSRAFKELGVQQFDELYSQANADHLFESLETGQITEDDFYRHISPFCTYNTSKDQVICAWNDMLLDFREESLAYLKRLAGKYQLFLLSNTNAIHLAAFNHTLQQQTGETSLDEYFTKSYYSHLIHLRKPYPDTYTWVLKDAGINAGETLFIDDSPNNIDGAIVAGLQTHLLLKDEKIENLGLL